MSYTVNRHGITYPDGGLNSVRSSLAHSLSLLHDMKKTKHTKLIIGGWIVILAFLVCWAVSSLTTFILFGNAEAERVSMLFSIALLFASPLVITFCGYAAAISIRVFSSKTFTKWIIAIPSAAVSIYLIFALTKIEWN
ncbi:hypothetical protein J3R74_000873 [Puniceicoccus vermicola]